MSIVLNGDQQARIGGKLAELSRQVFLQKEYGFNPERLDAFLQRAIEGRFNGSRRWIEKNGVIYFTLVSNGVTGEEWINHFKSKGKSIGVHVKGILQHADFIPTKAGTVHYIGVLKGELYTNNERMTRLIKSDAENRKMIVPHAEVACLICENFTDWEIKEMGLDYIITMHKPIPDSYGSPGMLGGASREDYVNLDAYNTLPNTKWNCKDGFAFTATEGPKFWSE
jgi:hypothetical protein